MQQAMKKSDKVGSLMAWSGLSPFPILIPIRLFYNKKTRHCADEISIIDHVFERLRMKARERSWLPMGTMVSTPTMCIIAVLPEDERHHVHNLINEMNADAKTRTRSTKQVSFLISILPSLYFAVGAILFFLISYVFRSQAKTYENSAKTMCKAFNEPILKMA